MFHFPLSLCSLQSLHEHFLPYAAGKKQPTLEPYPGPLSDTNSQYTKAGVASTCPTSADLRTDQRALTPMCPQPQSLKFHSEFEKLLATAQPGAKGNSTWSGTHRS